MTRLLISLFCLGLMAASPVMSQDTPLSAAQSDPETLGWMQGFPPPADRIIRMTDADAFTFPKLRWTMCNFRELTPTKAVRNGTDGADKLPVALDPGIDAVNFTPMGSDRKMTWDQAFDVNYTDRSWCCIAVGSSTNAMAAAWMKTACTASCRCRNP